MSENSKIEWTDHTFNPWEGCQKVGPGCDHCYAETRNARFAGGTSINWGPGAPRRRTSPANWRKPLKWNREAGVFYAQHRRRQRVFCASLADVFENAVDRQWRVDLFNLIEDTPNLDWLLLTKRIGNVLPMLEETAERRFDLDRLHAPQLPDNVWLGATVVNQEEADRDIPKLLSIPARVRFLSMEPLLGAVDLRLESRNDIARWDGLGRDLPLRRIDWVIVGGESGRDARPMHPEWARDVRDQCEEAGVPFLFKQWGEWAPGENCGGMPTRTERTADWFAGKWTFGTITPSAHEGLHTDDEPTLYRIGKKVAGRHLDGRTHDQFPKP
ncbi:phage Gp37/Gp68 family protein [Paraburkholderia sp. SIMBA_061]